MGALSPVLDHVVIDVRDRIDISFDDGGTHLFRSGGRGAAVAHKISGAIPAVEHLGNRGLHRAGVSPLAAVGKQCVLHIPSRSLTDTGTSI